VKCIETNVKFKNVYQIKLIEKRGRNVFLIAQKRINWNLLSISDCCWGII